MAVLAALVVAGLALVSVAQRSLDLATAAVLRERQLQLHWGTVSCQRTLLLDAERMFVDLEQQLQSDSRFLTSIETTIVLGDIPFRLSLSDEDAKVNLNILYHLGSRQKTERFVTERTRSSMLPVRLFPQLEPVESTKRLAEGEPLPTALASWGQVFDMTRAQGLGLGPGAIRAATVSLTCWGPGRLNLRRAPEDAVLTVCRLAISDGAARQMLRLYRQDPRRQLERIVEQLSVDPDKKALLNQLLTVQSSCYSLWVTVSAPSIAWAQFSVAERDSTGVVRTTSFGF